MRMGNPNITCVCICPTAKELLVAAGYQKPNSGALFVGLSSVMRSVLMDNRDIARVSADEWTITAGLQQVKQWIVREKSAVLRQECGDAPSGLRIS